MTPAHRFNGSFTQMVTSFWSNREIIFKMSKREVVSRYRGSILGLAWSFFNPILMLAVYTFVFSVIFKARWGADVASGKANFSILLFIGMIFHGLFAECANRAPVLIVTHVSYVKKVVFPLEVLPWVVFGSALFQSIINIIVLLTAQLLFVQSLPWTAIFLPLICLPLILATMGFSWFFAAIGVYLRDISQTVVIFTTVLLFLSPVFYPISALPAKYHIWVRLNPLAFIIEEGRKVLVFGMLPNWIGLGITTFTGLGMAWFGFWLFQRTRGGFADVL